MKHSDASILLVMYQQNSVIYRCADLILFGFYATKFSSIWLGLHLRVPICY